MMTPSLIKAWNFHLALQLQKIFPMSLVQFERERRVLCIALLLPGIICAL